jgi:hypothetical protein
VHGLQLAKVLSGYPVPLGRQGNGVDTGKHGERRVGVVPSQAKPLFHHPFIDLGMMMLK